MTDRRDEGKVSAIPMVRNTCKDVKPDICCIVGSLGSAPSVRERPADWPGVVGIRGG